MPFKQGDKNHPATLGKQYREEFTQWARDAAAESATAREKSAADRSAAPRMSTMLIQRHAYEEQAQRKASLRQSRSAPARFDFAGDEARRLGTALQRVDGHYKLVYKPPVVDWIEGNRILSAAALKELLADRRCNECRKHGVLIASAACEDKRGLGSILRCWCTGCKKVTLELASSEELAREAGKAKGRQLMEINLRAYTGVSRVGLGLSGLNRFLAICNLPTLSKNCYEMAGRVMKPAMIAAGEASERTAAAEERTLTYEATGGELDGEGRVLIGISFDTAWPKRGRGFNSQEGFGTAIGFRTGKVVTGLRRSKQCSRCKPGQPCGLPTCNANHVGSSGAMEPAMAVEAVERLTTEEMGVCELCTDLDSKIMAALTTAGIEVEQRIDPNHLVKAAKAKMLPEAKKQVGQRGVLSQAVMVKLGEELAMALNQHRGCGDAEKLAGALENVIDHAFGRHDNCLKFFECPCALGKREGSTYNRNGDWLDALGGPQLEAVLRREWKARMTGDDKLKRLLHKWSTQRNEAYNHMHITLHPKWMHLARSDTGLARQKFANAIWNDGDLASTAAVLQKAGIGEAGVLTERGLRAFDNERRQRGKRASTKRGKGLRKKQRKGRTARDKAQHGQAGAYGAGVGLDSDSDEEGAVRRGSGRGRRATMPSARELKAARAKLEAAGGDAMKLSVADLKVLLAAACLPVGGSKSALVSRVEQMRGGGGSGASASAGAGEESGEEESGEEDSGEEDSELDWSELEVTSAALAESHPAYSQLSELVGADVCVMAATFAGCDLERRNAIGWRGQVSRVRGRPGQAQVEVFGVWLQLADTEYVRPIVQVEYE